MKNRKPDFFYTTGEHWENVIYSCYIRGINYDDELRLNFNNSLMVEIHPLFMNRDVLILSSDQKFNSDGHCFDVKVHYYNSDSNLCYIDRGTVWKKIEYIEEDFFRNTEQWKELNKKYGSKMNESSLFGKLKKFFTNLFSS